MRHDHALVAQRAPVRDVKLAGLGIVKPLDLLGEHIDHEGIQVEALGEKSKGFRAALVGVAFGGILFFVHLRDDVGPDFLPRTQRFFQRGNEFQAGDLAHLAKDFIGSGNEVGIRCRLGIGRGRSDGRFLRRDGDTKQQGKTQEKSAQPETSVFLVRGHIIFRIAESRR